MTQNLMIATIWWPSLNPFGAASIVAMMLCFATKTLATKSDRLTKLQKPLFAAVPAAVLTMVFHMLWSETLLATGLSCVVILIACWASTLIFVREVSQIVGNVELYAPASLLLTAVFYEQELKSRRPSFDDHIATYLYLAFSIGMGMTLVRRRRGARRMIGVFSLVPGFMIFLFEAKNLSNDLLQTW